MREITTIDQVTGEILDCKFTTNKKVSPDNFIQVYLEDLASLMKINKASEIQVLIWLWKDSIYMTSDQNAPGNKVVINKQLYDLISKSTGYTESSIRNIVSKLTKKGFLLKDSIYRGVYYLNPKYFFKGSISDRMKKCKVVVEYELTPNLN